MRVLSRRRTKPSQLVSSSGRCLKGLEACFDIAAEWQRYGYLTHDVRGVAWRRRVALDCVKGASLSGLCRAIVSTTFKCTSRLEHLEREQDGP